MSPVTTDKYYRNCYVACRMVLVQVSVTELQGQPQGHPAQARSLLLVSFINFSSITRWRSLHKCIMSGNFSWVLWLYELWVQQYFPGLPKPDHNRNPSHTSVSWLCLSAWYKAELTLYQRWTRVRPIQFQSIVPPPQWRKHKHRHLQQYISLFVILNWCMQLLMWITPTCGKNQQ